MSKESLHVGINAQVDPSTPYGGITSVLIGLVKALGQLDDGPEQYTIITDRVNTDWLKPYLGQNQRIVTQLAPVDSAKKSRDILDKLGQRLIPYAKRLLDSIDPPHPPSPWPEIPVSDGFYESLELDVMHFPYQHFVLCAMPTIFNPHDLQHLHFPKFFTPQAIASREVMYPAGCRFAHTVVAGSHWIKEDIADKYRISPKKIQVIPWAPPTQAYQEPSQEQLEMVRAKYSLSHPFALYPAITWEHKNHIRLIEALAMLKISKRTPINLICTGGQAPEYWPRIKSRITALHLEDSVLFLGQVPAEDLRALYRLSEFVIVPTLFEAASGPVFEAWQERTPVACSAVTSLPEQVGDAALLFNPLSIDSIAEALHRMASEPDLRSSLQRKGSLRLNDFSWERTAKAYRAVYRRAAGHSLTEEDMRLLGWDWMKDQDSKEK